MSLALNNWAQHNIVLIHANNTFTCSVHVNPITFKAVSCTAKMRFSVVVVVFFFYMFFVLFYANE